MHAAAPDAVDAAARARGLAPAAPDPLEETRIRAGEGGPLPARVDEAEAAVARSSASPRWLRREVAGGGGQKRRHDEEAEAGGGGGRRRRSSSGRASPSPRELEFAWSLLEIDIFANAVLQL